MRTIRRSAVALGLAAALSLVATVIAGAATIASPHSATARAASGSTVVLTNSSNGSSVLALKGETVVVQLTGGPLRWSQAQALGAGGAAAVLVRVSGSVSPDGSSTTTFRVANYGMAQLRATGAPKCRSGAPCPDYVVLWRASVIVPVVDPPAPAAS